jgi:hypothetical protein
MVAVSQFVPRTNGGPPPPGPILDAEYRDIVKTEAALIGPKPDPRFGPTPRPDPKTVAAEAQTQRQNHQLRLLQSTMMELRVGMEVSAIFERDADRQEMGETEKFVIPFVQAEHNAILSFVEKMNYLFTSRARTAIDREETAAKESYLMEWWDDVQDAHINSGYGSFVRAFFYDAMIHAMTCLYIAPNPGNQRSGVRVRRVSPKVVFPIFEEELGLSQVYSIYDANYSKMIGRWGDGPRGSATRKIRNIAKGDHGDVDINTTHEVTEFYDRTWAQIQWHGEVIREWKHNLQRVPWDIVNYCWRQADGTAMSTGVLGTNGMPMGMRDSDGNLMGGMSIQRDIARIYTPFLANRVAINDELEMLTSRLFSGVANAPDAPLYHNKPSAAMGNADIEVKNWSGGVTSDGVDGKLAPLPTAPIADYMGPLMEVVKTALQVSIPAPVLQGQTLGAQSSGQAVDILSEMGYDMWVPLVKMGQKGLARAGHRSLEIQRDWQDSMPSPEGIGEGFPVPRLTSDKNGMYAPFKLTRKMLEDSGCYVECRMSKFSLAGMVGAISSAVQLNGIGIGDDRFYIEELGLPGAPEDLMQRRRTQNMENSPDYGSAFMINQMAMELKAAVARGDKETFENKLPLFRRIVQMQKTKDMQMGMMAQSMQQTQMQSELDMAMQEAGMGAGGGQMGALPPGMDPSLMGGAPQAGGFNPTVALQPGDLGNAVGDAGGRPQGGMPPGIA